MEGFVKPFGPETWHLDPECRSLGIFISERSALESEDQLFSQEVCR
jgi:hypothetical protein